MTKRILFVDDEPMVLQSIQRGLRGMRHEWDFEIATAGVEALARIARETIDVVITDMRMPGMDGAELLQLVKERSPQTIRMVLSGQSDQSTLLRAIGPTHQYLSKPCNVNELKQILKRALDLSDLLNNSSLRDAVSQLEVVHSVPAAVAALKRELRSPDPSPRTLAEIIMLDIGMTTKLLQLVNSAFFGTPIRISSIPQAVSVIGLDRLKILAVTLNVFSEFNAALASLLDPLWKHSVTVARCARAISLAQGLTEPETEDAYTAGLLHEIGRFVLATMFCDKYIEVFRLVSEQKLSRHESEQRVFGASHAEVGAYLLGLWGLPESLLKVVAHHRQPAHATPITFSPTMAVHIADSYVHNDSSECNLDAALIAGLGLSSQTSRWRFMCAEIQRSGVRL